MNIGSSAAPAFSWYAHTMQSIESLESSIDEEIASIFSSLFSIPGQLCRALGDAGYSIKENVGIVADVTYAYVKTGSDWLNRNEEGGYLLQAVSYLGKLPLRSLRNIVLPVYQIAKGCISCAIQPYKIPTVIAKLIVTSVYQITKPETWSHVGAGMVGTSLGYVVTGNPVSLLGIGGGSLLIITALAIGALQVFAASNMQECKKYLILQALRLPESALTGFFIGVIMGRKQRLEREKADAEQQLEREKATAEQQLEREKAAVEQQLEREKAAAKYQLEREKAIAEYQQNWRVTTMAEAEEFGAQFIKEHAFPNYSSIAIGKDGMITLTWAKDGAYEQLMAEYPQLSTFPDSIGFRQTLQQTKNYDLNAWDWYEFRKINGFQLQISPSKTTIGLDLECEHWMGDFMQDYNLGYTNIPQPYPADSGEQFLGIQDIHYPLPPKLLLTSVR